MIAISSWHKKKSEECCYDKVCHVGSKFEHQRISAYNHIVWYLISRASVGEGRQDESSNMASMCCMIWLCGLACSCSSG